MHNSFIMLLYLAFIQLVTICIADICQNQTLNFSSGDVSNITTRNITIDWFSEDDYFLSEDEDETYVGCQIVYVNVSNVDKEKGVGIGVDNKQVWEYYSCYDDCNITINCTGISNMTIMFDDTDNNTFSYSISSMYETCDGEDSYYPYNPYSDPYPYPSDDNNEIDPGTVVLIIMICFIGCVIIIFVICLICGPPKQSDETQTQSPQSNNNAKTATHNDEDMIELDEV